MRERPWGGTLSAAARKAPALKVRLRAKHLRARRLTPKPPAVATRPVRLVGGAIGRAENEMAELRGLAAADDARIGELTDELYEAVEEDESVRVHLTEAGETALSDFFGERCARWRVLLGVDRAAKVRPVRAMVEVWQKALAPSALRRGNR